MEVNPISEATRTDIADAIPEEAATEEMSQFLRLLTAQIENQDPLEPLDANQFIEQLATINSLEQQIQTNGFLEEILETIRDADLPNGSTSS